MELPFLKNKKKNQGGGSSAEVERPSDDSNPEKLKGMITDELMDSFHKKDHRGFISALRAFHQTTKEAT